MRGQEQHQERRTDHRRSLPGGIRMARDRPGVCGAAKDDRGDPAKYGFLLIGTIRQITVTLLCPRIPNLFIKVKSK